MNVHVLSLFLVLNFLGFSQKSYEFKNPLPPNSETVKTVSPIYFASYENQETGTVFLVNDLGLTMISTIHSFITQEQVRESSKYSFRNGYLFGVVENDSIQYIQEGDKYYFGIKHKVVLNDTKNGAVLKKISENKYIINFKEGVNFTPSLLTFVGKNLTIKHFDYPSETTVFDLIKDVKTSKFGDIDHFLLNPSQEEWEKLNQQIIFGKENTFVKQ